jgi:RNA polymerase sigma-70 factor, ECF subfamily
LRDVTTHSLSLATRANLQPSVSDQDLSRLTDEQLIQGLKAGRNEAMTYLFDRYYVIVRSIARKVLRNPEDVADVVQEAFLDVYQNARSFDPSKGALKGWLSCLAYHRCLRKLRSVKSKEWQSGDGEALSSVLDTHIKPEHWIRSLDFRKCLEKALTSVNEKQRRTMVLYFYEGKELAAIAKEIGESFGNARHHLYRGLAKVRSELVQNRLLEGYTEFGSMESFKKVVR